MQVNRVLVDHLTSARAELVAQRDEAAAGIRDIDAILSRYGVAPHDAKTVTSIPAEPREAVSETAGTVMDSLLAFMSEYPKVDVPALKVVEYAASLGTADNTARGMLGKLNRRGVIVRTGRGLYRLASNAGTPVAAGVPDGEEPTTGSSLEKGGSVNDTESPAGRDPDSGSSEPGYGHGNRASISEVLRP